MEIDQHLLTFKQNYLKLLLIFLFPPRFLFMNLCHFGLISASFSASYYWRVLLLNDNVAVSLL